ncbi:putative colanic acid biosynthesis acetyltransferase WcaF [Curtobacterium herbarum]|uniref:acetyltransferase n=1 Tax=Curtobacterium herbarum TaxID=150122 RepID=UPI0020A12813|nr:acetyltransferase [Curtobacterium herbarum]MCP1504242.1 putative colanic acid biosynthesis acetyltransferase WcaF [Curtobacterium herbarum]
MDEGHDRDRTDVPVIPLAEAPGERASWDRPRWVVYGWGVFELLFVYNPWQISSALRVKVLRAFGAEIGDGVIFRPRTRVRFPWKLSIGDDCWIGEGVWFHNQDRIAIGHDSVISQETFLTTGSHRHRSDMSLVTRPIMIEPGVWITSRCMVLGGATVGKSTLVKPMSVVDGPLEANVVAEGRPARAVGIRFRSEHPA